jgi:SAM-dependent methyltransferase
MMRWWRRPEQERTPPEEKGKISAEAVSWAIRMLLGREPRGASEIAIHARHASLEELQHSLMRLPEFRARYARVMRQAPRFETPDFLRRPPADPAVPWQFGRPTIAQPVSQLCTASQFEEPEFIRLVEAMHVPGGVKLHRKLWEHVWIAAILATQGMVSPGRRAIGFGCGRERMPAFLAARGMEVLATDAPDAEVADRGWGRTGQHSARVNDLFHERLIAKENFDRLVSFRPVDMNAIPPELHGRFDCCWSACSLEHLGSLRHGLDFIENSLAVLRPGGVAVHTTEFNLGSDEATFESPGVSIYRRKDLERLALRLVTRGHTLLPLNLDPGHTEVDSIIDVPDKLARRARREGNAGGPDAQVDSPGSGGPHLKLAARGLTITSVGIAVIKEG